jgi:hypothetical protein
MPIHSTFKKTLLKAGIVLAICSGLTVCAFPMLRTGPYQDNLVIQVVEDPI